MNLKSPFFEKTQHSTRVFHDEESAIKKLSTQLLSYFQHRKTDQLFLYVLERTVQLGTHWVH
mgnify:CR=1 FL=1